MFEPETHELPPISRREEPMPDVWLWRGQQKSLGEEQLCDGMWQTGEGGEFRKAMIRCIEQAQQLICVASFLWAESPLTDALLRAAGRGIRVYVLTASDQFLQKHITKENGWKRERLEEHKRLLRKFSGEVLVRTCESFHAKFLLVDPPTNTKEKEQPEGMAAFISTANFNPALIESVELGVRLDRREGLAMFDRFRRAFWGHHVTEGTKLYESRGQAERLATVQPRDMGTILPQQGQFRHTSPGSRSLQDEVLSMCQNAQKKLLVSCYGLDLGHETVEEMLRAKERGVDVVLLTRVRPAVSEVARHLQKAGVEVVGHAKLHAKAIVADDQALVMTANLQHHGMDVGFEVGARLEGAKAKALEEILTRWRESFGWQLRCNGHIGEHTGKLKTLNGWKDGEIITRQVLHIPEPVVAVSALERTNYQPPQAPPLPQAGQQGVWAQEVVYTYQVRPPHLPKGATEVRIEKKRPAEIYNHKSSIYVKGKEDDPNVQELLQSYRVPKNKTLKFSERPPRKATRIPPPSRSHEPPLYQHGKKHYVVISSQQDQEAARQLADKYEATIVVLR